MKETDKRKQDLVQRLKRIEGQVRGVQKLLQDDAPVEAIAQQLSAARKAADRAFFELVATEFERTRSTDIGSLASASSAIAHIAGIFGKYG